MGPLKIFDLNICMNEDLELNFRGRGEKLLPPQGGLGEPGIWQSRSVSPPPPLGNHHSTLVHNWHRVCVIEASPRARHLEAPTLGGREGGKEGGREGRGGGGGGGGGGGPVGVLRSGGAPV